MRRGRGGQGGLRSRSVGANATGSGEVRGASTPPPSGLRIKRKQCSGVAGGGGGTGRNGASKEGKLVVDVRVVRVGRSDGRAEFATAEGVIADAEG